MKTLYIYTQFLYPGQISEAVLLSDIVEFASQSFKGQVVCVCATRNDADSEWYSSPNLKIIRQNPPNFNKDKRIQRALAFAIIALRFWWHAIWHVKKDDIAFTVTLTPGYFMYMLYLLRCIRKFQYVLLVYDTFPDNLIPGGFNPNSLLFKFLKYLYKKVYRKIDRIIAIGCDMKERISWMTQTTDNITIIQNWANEKTIKPMDKSTLDIVHKLNLQDDIVFAYIGNISIEKNIETILEVADKISNPKVKFLFIGKGLLLPMLEEHIKKSKKHNVIYAGSFPIQEQAFFLNACDVSFITLGSKMYGIAVPSKTYYNMACGKPLLISGADGTEIVEMAKKYHLGEIVTPCNSEMLLDAIETMSSPDYDLRQKGQHVYDVFISHFSKKHAAEKYQSFFSLLN